MITYHVGDLFEAIKKIQGKTIIIPHICNDVGAWGAGFVVPLGKHFPGAKRQYLNWYSQVKLKFGHDLILGDTSEIDCDYGDDNKVVIINMIAQSGLISKDNPNPINYTALSQCLKSISGFANKYLGKPPTLRKIELHTCAFGTGLAGGRWDFISTLIEENITCPVHIYSLSEEEREKLILVHEKRVVQSNGEINGY